MICDDLPLSLITEMLMFQVYGPMPDEDRVMLHSLGNLTIYQVKKEDGGDYECVAEDGDISSVASTELIIESKSDTVSAVRYLLVSGCTA